MSEQNGQLYTVRRPDDGLVVPLTCTPREYEEVWQPQGYVSVNEPVDTPIAETETPPSPRKRS